MSRTELRAALRRGDGVPSGGRGVRDGEGATGSELFQGADAGAHRGLGEGTGGGDSKEDSQLSG